MADAAVLSITTKSPYAVRALVELAKSGGDGPVPIGELALSTSTVRTHLHNIYGKLGAVDRAQAVLIATERGWL